MNVSYSSAVRSSISSSSSDSRTGRAAYSSSVRSRGNNPGASRPIVIVARGVAHGLDRTPPSSHGRARSNVVTLCRRSGRSREYSRYAHGLGDTVKRPATPSAARVTDRYGRRDLPLIELASAANRGSPARCRVWRMSPAVSGGRVRWAAMSSITPSTATGSSCRRFTK